MVSSPSPSVQEPPSPSLSAEATFSPSLLLRVPFGPSFDEECTRLPGPEKTPGDYDYLTYDTLDQLCRRRGYAKKNSKAVLKTRLSTMDADDRKRVREKGEAASTPGDMPVNQGKRRRADDLYFPPVGNKEIVEGDAQRLGPGAKAHWDAANTSPLVGADAAISVEKGVNPRKESR